MPQAVPNYLNTNGSGETGAVFPGGIELLQSVTFNTPVTERRVTWVKESNGALAASIHSSASTNGQNEHLIITQGAETQSANMRAAFRCVNAADAPLDWSVTSPTVADGAGYMIQRRAVGTGGNSNTQVFAEGESRTLLDHNGGSDLLQFDKMQFLNLTGPWLAAPPVSGGSAGGDFVQDFIGERLFIVSASAYINASPGAYYLAFTVNGTGYTSTKFTRFTINFTSNHVTFPTVCFKVFLTGSKAFPAVHHFGIACAPGLTSDSADFCNVAII